MRDATLEAIGDIAKAEGMVESALNHLEAAHAAADDTPEPPEGGRRERRVLAHRLNSTSYTTYRERRSGSPVTMRHTRLDHEADQRDDCVT